MFATYIVQEIFDTVRAEEKLLKEPNTTQKRTRSQLGSCYECGAIQQLISELRTTFELIGAYMIPFSLSAGAGRCHPGKLTGSVTFWGGIIIGIQ